MELKAFSIRDEKGEIYHPPFYVKTHGEAERSFAQLLEDPKSTINQYPEDFDLYHVGEFDDQTGKFTPCTTPQHIVKAANVKRRSTVQ